ncbi:tetratricopeptide repeat protein 39B-like [Syngnathus scovelli]|uniref:tetratricopeptide repeat protein 39B-like n=1 Tax=Syngnathus scovelli TaxID=161590 RepID=UPI00210FA4A6|nr:tetratricopeptide repeat protein 39B-like [Syngnathus scovelli]XP_049576657.1 tetratricopeptide repeat protein 39B-like [Syngnathus scovelli]XP_049576659.1 tetratricopeptide repeat protein 39B-like [Syngnathus scovelli]
MELANGNYSLNQVEKPCSENVLEPPIDLETALKECSSALDLFLNNKFSDALALLAPWKSQSMYHAMGYSSMLVMQAGMTFDPKDMNAAMESLSDALLTCQRFRKKTGIMETLVNLWQRQSPESLTEEEMHAELCYAEVLLQKAALTFLDESIIGFIKGGMRMRTSYQIFKECQALVQGSAEMEKKSTYVHFKGGVSMGIGSFNLMLSLLPARILKLMEFLGFSGDREVGLSELQAGASSDSLRSILSTLTLLMFHLYISVILGSGDVDLSEAEALLEPYANRFPNGALMLFYVARISLLKGNITFAEEKFHACIAAQQEWRQIHHLCYWELMWAYSFEQNWREAYHYADLLCKESKWSQAVYMFQKASILSMLPEEEVKKLGENVEDLFREVDGLRLRLAGKSIPTEKFAAKKAQRYVSSKPVKLVVPALEMMYVWNGFTIVGKRPDLTENILATLEKAEEELKYSSSPSDYHLDDQCVVQLLKGLCLRQLGRLDQAEVCFNHVLSSESDLKYDNYLVPFTMYEMGLLHKQRGDMEKAIFVLESAKLNYKDYSMESRLHFRIHAVLNSIGSFAAKIPPSRMPA